MTMCAELEGLPERQEVAPNDHALDSCFDIHHEHGFRCFRARPRQFKRGIVQLGSGELDDPVLFSGDWALWPGC